MIKSVSMKFEFPGHRIFKISIFQGSNSSNTFSHDSFSTRAQLPSVFNIRTYIFGIICGPLTFLHMNEDNIYNKILGGGIFTSTWTCTKETNRETKNGIER